MVFNHAKHCNVGSKYAIVAKNFLILAKFHKPEIFISPGRPVLVNVKCQNLNDKRMTNVKINMPELSRIYLEFRHWDLALGLGHWTFFVCSPVLRYEYIIINTVL